MQLPVCCQCPAPPPAPASNGQRSHWQTGREPGRVSERGEQEQQAERGRNTRDREEERVRERLVLREKKKQRTTSDWKQEWGVETEECIEEQRGKCTNFIQVTSRSSLAAGWMETEEGSGFPGEGGKPPLALLLRTWPPTCLYAPLVPDGCSCGCSWRFGEDGVDVNTRVLSAVTSACRTSIYEPDRKNTEEEKYSDESRMMGGKSIIIATAKF